MGDPNPPHRVAQVFFTVTALQMPMNVLSAGLGCYPDLVVEITDVVEEKVRAIDARRSQQYRGDYARERIEMTDGAIGSIGGVAYGEGFITYRPEVAKLFPMSEWLLQLATESEGEQVRRLRQIIATKVDLPD
jgi:hypothetical protein